jgi:hypothetical protein
MYFHPLTMSRFLLIGGVSPSPMSAQSILHSHCYMQPQRKHLAVPSCSSFSLTFVWARQTSSRHVTLSTVTDRWEAASRRPCFYNSSLSISNFEMRTFLNTYLGEGRGFLHFWNFTSLYKLALMSSVRPAVVAHVTLYPALKCCPPPPKKNL